MSSNPATIPPPPRLSGNNQADLAAIVSWAYDLYKAVVVEQQLPDRLNAIADLDPITTTISATPTQAEVDELKQKINAIINAASPATSEGS